MVCGKEDVMLIQFNQHILLLNTAVMNFSGNGHSRWPLLLVLLPEMKKSYGDKESLKPQMHIIHF